SPRAPPAVLARPQSLEQPRGFLDLDRRGPELALALERDLATEHMCHEVHAVADAEDRHASVEDLRIDRGRIFVVHARRSAREDHADDVAARELLRGDVVREDLAVDAGLADAPCD